MFTHVFDLLFGCWHQNFSFPITAKANRSRGKATHVVCLDCGREFPYDWEKMQITSEGRLPRTVEHPAPLAEPAGTLHRAA